MATIQTIAGKTKNGLSLVLKSPAVADGAKVLEAVRVIMRESKHLLTEPDEFSYTEERENELICAYASHPDMLMIVPVIEGRISGMLNFAPGTKRRVAHQGSFGISLLPEHQGQGVGRAMMDTLIRWACDNPRIEFLRLRVHGKNRSAIELYRKCGFAEEGRERPGVQFCDRTYDDVLCMLRPGE